MKVALITPTPLLMEFAGRSKYHLILADEVIRSKEYRDFYAYRVSQGDYVLLDNCAYELGEALSNSDLKHCIQAVGPTAMFLPDVRFDRKKTITRVRESLRWFRHENVKLFAVPQGNSLDEVIACYTELMSMPDISGFGIYEEIGEVTGLGRRSDFLQYLVDYNLVSPTHTYHCLGMEEDIEQVQAIAEFQWVSGIDSAKPIVYGIHGIELTPEGARVPYPHRPKHYFAYANDEFRNILHKNITQVQAWASQKEEK